MLPGLKTPFGSRRAEKKMEGKKTQVRKDREKDPQTPMVSKVAQQAEHYALSNSKCCWQAGWLLAGEGLSASLLQIQASHTVDICNGTPDNTAALQSHGRPDRTAHHTQQITCMPFLQRMQHFLYSNPHTVHLLFSIFETDALWEAWCDCWSWLWDVDSSDYAI